jgi:predicted HicB family RNase H-like nuclease
VKRIIDGRTYNTDTSTLIARYEYVDDKGYDTTANIFQNRNGAFFIVHEWSEETVKGWDDYEKEKWEQKVMKYYFEASNREKITQLVARQDNIEILDERALTAPPEAEEEAEPAATAYLRLPLALKNRVEAAARKDGLSLNAWAIRCFENCAGHEATM